LRVDGYGSRFIATTFGIPVSALHYWDRTGLVKPSVRPAAGRGSKRLFGFRDLTQLLVVWRLRDMGVSLQRIRKCLAFLQKHAPELEAPFAEKSLVTDGETIFLLTDDSDKVLDTLREQFVWSVPVGALLRSARETIEAATTPRTERVKVAGRRFTVTMEQDPEDGWWVGLVQELPGCGSQGGSLEELRHMVADAIHGYLVARGDISEDAQSRQAAAV
jgi:DNA-binding transcriptional MerR regulator